MPLKHFTETFLVVVLGAVIALIGLMLATLPPLPNGALPWGLLFVLSVAYPLVLTPLFRRRRADYVFRILHLLPAVLLLLWLVLQVLIYYEFLTSGVQMLYTWGWTLWPVVLSFVFLIGFCLKVIRRRKPRLTFLLIILIPFTALAVYSEQEGNHYERELASVLWDSSLWQIVEQTGSVISGDRIADNRDTERNLDTSEDPEEEEWRERLRAQERRRERIAARLEEQSKNGSLPLPDIDASSEASESEEESSSVAASVSSVSSAVVAYGQTSSRPNHLPTSGFGFGAFGVALLAGYCGTLHQRATRRANL